MAPLILCYYSIAQITVTVLLEKYKYNNIELPKWIKMVLWLLSLFPRNFRHKQQQQQQPQVLLPINICLRLLVGTALLPPLV